MPGRSPAAVAIRPETRPPTRSVHGSVDLQRARPIVILPAAGWECDLRLSCTRPRLEAAAAAETAVPVPLSPAAVVPPGPRSRRVAALAPLDSGAKRIAT